MKTIERNALGLLVIGSQHRRRGTQNPGVSGYGSLNSGSHDVSPVGVRLVPISRSLLSSMCFFFRTTPPACPGVSRWWSEKRIVILFKSCEPEEGQLTSNGLRS